LSIFVLDASVPLIWFLHGTTADYAASHYSASVKKQLALGKHALVPALWHLEMANGIASSLRAKYITSDEADLALARIEALIGRVIETANDIVTARRVLATARMFQLSAYDATYLDLARMESLPLATLDKRFRSAAERAGVEIYQP
jgi:predicted nucleic acid-binding protein